MAKISCFSALLVRKKKKKTAKGGVAADAVILSGHISDPGVGQKSDLCGSPRLKRSCSNIETQAAAACLPLLSPSKSLSYKDLQALLGNGVGSVSHEFNGSPLSVITSCSADRVILKKKSSSQVLPSRSRKLWWRLFLWSHRNLHSSWNSSAQKRIPTPYDGFNSRKGGYSSDTLEPGHGNEGQEAAAGCGRSQWVAFSMESSSSSSPLDRVNAWVNSLEDNPCSSVDFYAAETPAFPDSPDDGEQARKNSQQHQSGRRQAEEVFRANHIIQSLNPLSTVAHISGMGLHVVPTISAFTSLRAVNLSNNSIAHINPGALPKSLHALDLSRNRITTIEGLRDLTRLRVLNLSYNKISRIGHGLSNCTLIKELYLAGNKISNVEGLHRLLKLAVLDLSFNKVTTAKALGQLVANYNTLLVLNLLGNPVQSNIGDDQLRKVVAGLLPQLAYLNKQPIKPQRAREGAADTIAKAALGNNTALRRPTRRASQAALLLPLRPAGASGWPRRRRAQNQAARGEAQAANLCRAKVEQSSDWSQL
ncbi:unnamed protein product [Spirodela intermedia]|uniref:Uncharacterized protein n=1 Tax=Spirodela intermedia TaxID=51605 RepID=A0A7I8IMZ8_SPIIN|nr:unnamed protein product [Spirodela intermedia]CAA6658832.1 unnamed protein product [Spirodela intermedia]